MTPQDIQARIDALKQERDAFQRQAELQMAVYQGGIQALELLVKAADAEHIVNQTFDPPAA
jgi:hypothetical protein